MKTEIIEAFDLKIGDFIVLKEGQFQVIAAQPMHSMDEDDCFEGIGIYARTGRGQEFRHLYDILDSVRIIKRKEQKNGD